MSSVQAQGYLLTFPLFPPTVVIVLSLLSRVWLFATPQTVACQALLSMGILLSRILEWVTGPCSWDLLNPGIKCRSAALQVDSLPSEPSGKPSVQFSSVAQLCPTLCDPIDCSLPGFCLLHLLELAQICSLSQWCHPTILPSPFSLGTIAFICHFFPF